MSRSTNFTVIYPCFPVIFPFDDANNASIANAMGPSPLFDIDHGQGLGICPNRDSTSFPETVCEPLLQSSRSTNQSKQIFAVSNEPNSIRIMGERKDFVLIQIMNLNCWFVRNNGYCIAHAQFRSNQIEPAIYLTRREIYYAKLLHLFPYYDVNGVRERALRSSFDSSTKIAIKIDWFKSYSSASWNILLIEKMMLISYWHNINRFLL